MRKRLVWVALLAIMIGTCLHPDSLRVQASIAPMINNGETYYIKNVNSGQYLTVAGSGDLANPQNVVQNKLGGQYR